MNTSTLPAAWVARRAYRMAPTAGTEAAPAAFGNASTHRVLQRRCALTPALFVACLAALVGVSVVVGAGFWWAGAPYVSLFCGLEVVALALGFSMHALHACDGETLQRHGSQLVAISRRGRRLQRTHFSLALLQWRAGHAGTLVLCGHGAEVVLGSQLPPLERGATMLDLRRTLAAWRAAARGTVE